MCDERSVQSFCLEMIITMHSTGLDDDNSALVGFNNGDIDWMMNFPSDELPALIASGKVVIADYLGTYFVSFNNQKAPFDDVRVRKAFSLAIDRNYIVNAITQSGEKPADAFVPYGVADAAPGSDFRTTGGPYYSVAASDYEKNCDEARKLLADAGYPGGENFPVVEYIYNTNDRHRAIGEGLQNMWKSVLGVNVTLDNQDWSVYIDRRKAGNYEVARHGWIADFNDPISFLDLFISTSGNDDPQYRSRVYDNFIRVAQSTSVPEERMKAMHEAEDVFMGTDHAVAPVYFYTQPYMLNEKYIGLYNTPLGFFYFDSIKEK
jgi:oligopeptide transport system substrate-binding protein